MRCIRRLRAPRTVTHRFRSGRGDYSLADRRIAGDVCRSRYDRKSSENTFLCERVAEYETMRRFPAFPGIVSGILLLFACSPQNILRFEDMHIAYTPGPVLGMYGAIHNGTGNAHVLESVRSDRFKRIEIHLATTSEGRMRMERIDTLTIPARSAVELAPGKAHIMLFEATEPVKNGEIIPITITLSGTTHSLEVLVRGNP